MNDFETPQDNQSDEINLREYAHILVRWWRLILLCALLGGAIAFGSSFLNSRSYAAEANIVLVRTSTIVNLDSKIRTVSNTDPTSNQVVDQVSLRKSLTTIANSDDLAQVVFDSLRTQLDTSVENATSLKKKVHVENEGDSFQIKVRANSPQESVQIANTWASEFIARANSIYSESPVSLELLGGQLESARKDYESKQTSMVANIRESKLDKLQQEHDEKQGVLNTLQTGKTTAVQSAITEIQQVQVRLLREYLNAITNTRATVFNQQVNSRILKLQDLYNLRLKLERLLGNARALRARLAQSSQSVQSGNGLALMLLESSAFTTWADLPVSLQVQIGQLDVDRTTEEQQRDLDTLVAEIERQHTLLQSQIEDASQLLLADTGYNFLDNSTPDEKSPLRLAIHARVQALLNLEGLDDIASYSVSNTNIIVAIDRLQKDINDLESQIEVENAKRRDLVRARDLAWDIYTSIANKLAESQVTADARGGVVRLASSAIAPSEPVSANRPVIGLWGFLIGLFVGVGLSFALDFLTSGLNGSQRVSEVLKLPTLAEIPIWSPRENEAQLPALVNEALRRLRYRLTSMPRPRVIMFTSALPSEGVSTLAASLARVSAGGGQKVLLVDANLREPGVHPLFNLDRVPGLSDLLETSSAEMSNWRRFVSHPISNLTILPAGSTVTDPAALLQRENLELFVRQVKQEFDLVVIDAPAVNSVIDSIEIARVVDSVLLVVAGNRTPSSTVTQAKADLLASGARIIGVALNRIGRIVDDPVSRKNAAEGKVTLLPDVWAGLRARLFDLVGPGSR